MQTPGVLGRRFQTCPTRAGAPPLPRCSDKTASASLRNLRPIAHELCIERKAKRSDGGEVSRSALRSDAPSGRSARSHHRAQIVASPWAPSGRFYAPVGVS